MANGTTESQGWMSDVQRVIGLLLVGTIALCTVGATIMLIVSSAPDGSLVDMAKTLQAAVVNMTLIALGFFFGSNMSKVVADAGQQKIVEKLTSPTVPAPVAVAAVIAPWWSKLTDTEKNVIAANAKDDPRVNTFMTASASGAATTDDLDYLVTKGLLTQARADEIKSL